MIIKIIQKHAVFVTLAAIILCAIAAPFLITENPDSAIFRSGTFGLILLCACFYPAYQALMRIHMRTLISCACFSLLFALALSLGAELFVYDGLLPGMGSLLRRLAVPCMATPLFTLLFAYLMQLSPKEGHHRIPLWCFVLVLFICWLPLLFTYFPAALNYDFPGQVGQYLDGRYSDSQPMLHTAFAAILFRLGESLFGFLDSGLLMMTLIQMILFALSLAYACDFSQCHGAPLWVLLLMTAYFALHPLFSVMSISTTKDTLFASAILIFSLQTYEILEEGAAFFQRRSRILLYIIMAVLIALLRSNGLVSLIMTFPFLLLVCRGLRKKIVFLYALCALASVTTSTAIDLAFSPEDMSIHQSLSLPSQQLVRAYNLGNLSDEEKAEIESWFLSEYGLILHPHLADGAKGYLNDDMLHADMGGFFSLWLRTLAKCPREYIEAFLMLNIGSWYPDDISHANIYRDASYVEKGYLQTIEYDMTQYGLHTTTFLPGVQKIFESICRFNAYLKYPLLSHLFNTALPLWLLLFAAAMFISRGRSRYLPAFLCPIVLWGTYLIFGPCTLARYMLPLFVCAPPMLCAAFFHKESHL